MKKLLTIGIVAGQLILRAQSPTGPSHFNHILFRIPEGWSSRQLGPWFALTPPDLANGEFLSYFLLPPAGDNSFAEVAEATIREVATIMGGKPIRESFGQGPVFVKENEARHAKGWEYSIGHGLFQAVAGKDAVGLDQILTYYTGVFLARINGRIERVVFVSRDFRAHMETCRTYLKPAYEPVIRNFFFSLEFDDWNDRSAAPGKITHTGISDIWDGLAYFEGSEGQGLFEGSVKATYLAFFDNGQVYYNKELPLHGMREINSFTEAGLNSRWWGTYTYRDGTGTITLPYVTIPFSLKDGKIYLDIYKSHIPFRRTPVTDGMRLEGTWSEAATGFGNPASIRFTGEGQFVDQGVVLRIEHPIGNCFPSTPLQGEGHYEIKDNSIVFRYDNGLVRQAAFSGLGMQRQDASPGEIHLGFHDDTFKKR
ncbi:MAG TPA: hypothetical protein VMH27_08895 [Puia sp.]|nr:hypothetical protein [Puia sp.]